MGVWQRAKRRLEEAEVVLPVIEGDVRQSWRRAVVAAVGWRIGVAAGTAWRRAASSRRLSQRLKGNRMEGTAGLRRHVWTRTETQQLAAANVWDSKLFALAKRVFEADLVYFS